MIARFFTIGKHLRPRDALAFAAIPFPYLIGPAGWLSWFEEHRN